MRLTTQAEQDGADIELVKTQTKTRRVLPRARRLIAAVLGSATIVASAAYPAASQVGATEYEGAAALGLALRQLGTTKRVLMIGAHPDDEATQVLSTLALGQGAEVAYLSLTRGEGGQNGIGGELQEGLGLLRSGELLAARRLDGARQFFTRAIDYGFSKNADEAFRNWPREELLRDVVAVVRYFRPDVIVSVFTGTPVDGHGQHQAAGIMATEAFAAAADPDRFPEQIAAGLRPHAAVHLYQIQRGDQNGSIVALATGDLDPLLGQSHFQVAMASRSRHRSQDMGRELTPGPQTTPLVLVASRNGGAGVNGGNAGVGTRTSAGVGAEPVPPGTGGPTRSLFAGVDTTLTSWARTLFASSRPANSAEVLDLLTAYQATIDDARRVFNPFYPEMVVPFLTEAALLLDRALAATRTSESNAELRFRLADERDVISDAILRASRIRVDAIADDEAVVPGQTFELELEVWNSGETPVELGMLEPRLPSGWVARPRNDLPARLEAGSLVRREFEVTVPADAPPSQPYYLEQPREGAFYSWPAAGDDPAIGFPFEESEVGMTAAVVVRDVVVETSLDASYRGVDTRSGEFRRPVRVVPGVSVMVEPGLVAVPTSRRGQPVPVSVRLVAEEPGGIAGTLRLTAPSGWRVEPATVPVRFEGEGEQRVVELTVTPPTTARPGRVTLTAVVEDARGRRFDTGYALVDYPHVEPRSLFRSAAMGVEVVDVTVPQGLRVGYVAAVGDNVPQALAQLGVQIEMLDEEALATAPLDDLDVIVVGSRAYEGRPDLVTHNRRLLDYVESGGTMIVQYNQYQYTEPGLAPFPVSMARPHDRVTDENAAVTLLEPDHIVLNWPNRITADDFEGWVQERGLYFLNTWDDRYTPLLETADPGEEPKRGVLMVAPIGQGTYVYTGLALFRQLPAGVPGAYRLFANLLALGADR